MDFQQISNRVERPFTFAVVGDTHFAKPAFFSDGRTDSFRPLHVEQYLENVDYVLSPMMEALKAESPAFVVMTGDLVEGHGDPERGRAEMQAGLDFFGSYGIPLLLARGNHDQADAFDEVGLRALSRQLGWEMEARYYFADFAGCRFVVLDSTTWRRGDGQGRWLEDLLRHSRNIDIDRIFLFAHHPIWPVARAFFTTLDFHLEVPEILGRYPVDAFFCGHAHNQSFIAHRTGGGPALQFMGAPIGLPEESPTPLNRVQAMLIPPDDLLACWAGYVENTAPGWFTVRVEGASVKVEWHHLNRGIEAAVQWYRRGDIASFWEMTHPPDARLIHSDLDDIRRASLRFCAWDAMQPGKRVFLNGEDVGVLPSASYYAPRRMELPAWALEGILMENRIEILAPEDEASTIGNLMLEAVLPGGRTVRTRPSCEVLTWSDRWDAWGLETLQKVPSGRSILSLLSFR